MLVRDKTIKKKKHGEMCEALASSKRISNWKIVQLQQEIKSKRVIINSMSKCMYQKLHIIRIMIMKVI